MLLSTFHYKFLRAAQNVSSVASLLKLSLKTFIFKSVNWYFIQRSQMFLSQRNPCGLTHSMYV